MTESKIDLKKQNVLDAAERLLREGKAEFSMRDLAAEAGVSFATPFNQFGNKAAIMQALSARRIDTMLQRFSAVKNKGDTIERVLSAMSIAAEVMVEEPLVNKGVMSWIGASTPTPGHVLEHSIKLWALAFGDGVEGIRTDLRDIAFKRFPTHLAFGFRGVLSFWTSGEIADHELSSTACEMAKTILTGFTVQKLL